MYKNLQKGRNNTVWSEKNYIRRTELEEGRLKEGDGGGGGVRESKIMLSFQVRMVVIEAQHDSHGTHSIPEAKCRRMRGEGGPSQRRMMSKKYRKSRLLILN